MHSKILSADRDEGIPEALMPGGEGSGASADNFEFGVDPSIDPELAMVSSSCYRIYQHRLI